MEGSFRPRQEGLRKLLGDLEAGIMEIVWSRPAAERVTVRDVYETLMPIRKVAYTTVMTVMGNLTKKGVLKVEKEGTAYLYHAPLSQDEFTKQAVGNILDGLMADFSGAALAHIAKTLEPENEGTDLLDSLKRRIEQARENG